LTFQLKENSLPLTDEEQADCCALVKKFLMDTDHFAILPVIPDMRMIQECFRILKSNLACPTRKVSNAMRLYGSMASMGSSIPGTAEAENGLIQTIARRDAEISKYAIAHSTHA
jgi:hypothetical protein